MIDWYIKSADDEAECPACKQFLLERIKKMPDFWLCKCGYSDDGKKEKCP